ncbi:hypothetical protein WJX81_003196 [Elliptochloris bilobata]|uniref:Uncharacterized protein n=1 Tax=Elliptochloris bilobata TaxID=381761 RepID=A0AAW1RMF5_9CHLO
MQLLDLDLGVLYQVLDKLNFPCLVCLGSSCAFLHNAIFRGPSATILWKARCEQELGPSVVAVHAHAAAGASATARHWVGLLRASLELEDVWWWGEGAAALMSSCSQVPGGKAPKCGFTDAAASGLARTGHTATTVGTCVVVIGGHVSGGPSFLDVLVVHLDTLRIARPVVHGAAPTARIGHATAVVAPPPGSHLAALVAAAVGPARTPAAGAVLAVFGGCSPGGTPFGGHRLEVLWVANDGSEAAWLHVLTSGRLPHPCMCHSADAFNGGRSMVVCGGTIGRLSMSLADATHMLDVGALVWYGCNTGAFHGVPDGRPSCSGDNSREPRNRTLHLTAVRRSPTTGREELVVRASAARVSPRWLLVTGGSSEEGTFLDDVQRLDMNTLKWAPPPRVGGRSCPPAMRRTAGHSLAGLCAFGGCMPAPHGILPIVRTDLLLLGRSPWEQGVPADAAYSCQGRSRRQSAQRLCGAPLG